MRSNAFFGLAALGLALAGCPREEAPPLPEVRLHATVSELAVQAAASGAAREGIARVRPVAGGPAAADVAWFGEPTEALEAAGALAPGSAPPQPDVAARWKDAKGRFAPVCARARVLVLAPGAKLAFRPAGYGDLADPRLAGRQALAHPASGLGPATFAALAVARGEAAVEELLGRLARARPRVAASDAEVRLLVAGGAAAVGLTGSEEAAAGAVSAAALEVAWPAEPVVLPTAAALARGGAPSEAARRFLEWLAGPRAERLLAARAPGLMPLRAGVPLPPAVLPAGAVAAPILDWDELAAARRRVAPLLARWPEP